MLNPRVKLTPLLGPWLVLLALFIHLAPTHAFFRHLCQGELGNGRVDPIMSPGSVSQHLHVAFGASNFGFDPTLDDLLSSNCTSCSILQDHSAYWTPRMYFQHSNGTFEMVPTSGGLTVYYFTERSELNEPVIAFPQNFRMIAGNSLKRAFYGPMPDPPLSKWQDSDRTQESLMEKALGFNCLHYGAGYNEGSREYHYLRNKAYLDSTCTEGVRAELMFPSCWNGKDLDSDNHNSHVAYPNFVQNGPCPDGFPVRLPALFYETIYQTNLFRYMDGEFTFSNGDPTGFGYHGDFMCAWEDGVLQAAIDDPVCNVPITNGNQDDCPVFKLQDPGVGTQCKMEMPESIQNESVNHLQVLPGNVQVQAGPAPATVLDAPSFSTAAPSVGNLSLAAPAEPTPATPLTSSCALNGAAGTTPFPSAAQTTFTTDYISNGTKVHMILVEEVVTVTVSSEVALPSDLGKRHAHKHGHREFGRRRL